MLLAHVLQEGGDNGGNRWSTVLMYLTDTEASGVRRGAWHRCTQPLVDSVPRVPTSVRAGSPGCPSGHAAVYACLLMGPGNEAERFCVAGSEGWVKGQATVRFSVAA